MSTHRAIDKICCVVIALSLLLTFVLMGCAVGRDDATAPRSIGYETRLFDDSKVHTIDIVMDDFDSFIENCMNEEYVACTVVIDGESHKNVGIRAKGNTSLTNVQSYGNDRYSFKLEFDHYDKNKSYHGLDKLSLNNIIQDNTYQKDYLCYKMMAEMGVAAPLCSYVDITVNGNAWGLYLAVEGVEDSFLARNYGSDTGELYKPDSTDMGGGRGNGGDFDMDDLKEKFDLDFDFDLDENGAPTFEAPGQMPMPDQATSGASESIAASTSDNGAQSRGGMQPPNGEMPSQDGNMQPPNGEMPSQGGNMQPPDGFELPEGVEPPDGFELPENVDLPEENGTGTPSVGDDTQVPSTDNERPGGMGGMGSDDVALIYTNDEYDSYKNIFDNAKTDITEKDKDRLIASLKSLSQGENIEETVDTEAVIRYFAVHNFVCNFDSYTGSLMHNYYLYEKDGKLSMLPWDYNLAFGGFQGAQNATALVNYPIDDPTSGAELSARPMLAWIFNNDEYKAQYHLILAEMIEKLFDSGYVSDLINTVSEMIAPYVEKDATKFCTYEEFEKGSAALLTFCEKRAESISKQLDGSLPSTEEEQKSYDGEYVDASDLNINDMGSMMGGGGNGGKGDMPGGFDGEMPNFEKGDGMSFDKERPTMPDASKRPDLTFGAGAPTVGNSSGSGVLLLCVASAVILLCGIAVIFAYRKKA